APGTLPRRSEVRAFRRRLHAARGLARDPSPIRPMSPPICAPRAAGSGRRAGAGRLPAACDRSSGACELAFSLLIYRTVRAFAAANANFSMVGPWGRVVLEEERARATPAGPGRSEDAARARRWAPRWRQIRRHRGVA